MSKKIAFCADGTWDTSANNSNVYRIHKSLPTTATQVAFYDDGLGCDGTPVEKLVGGAFGEGLFRKIKDAYTKIAHAWDPGDEIFLFGFSRGAYTVRCLAGMIAICGLPASDEFTDALVDTAFSAYRHKDQRGELLASLGQFQMTPAIITMVGVFDTVGSLGIPAVFGAVDVLRYGFLDTGLHPNVRNAFQALAIDERRSEFPPTLWSTAAPGQVVEQVWFTGVHCDVGGGYPADTDGSALSDITLAWMLDKASRLGLTIEPAMIAKYRLPLDPRLALARKHESWGVMWGVWKHRNVDAEAAIADSVAARCTLDPSYRPQRLTFSGGKLSGDYRLEKIVTA